MDADFERRAAMARKPTLSPDVWTKPAADMIRIAAFAGFDVQRLIVECLKGNCGNRVNIRTVERIMGEMESEFK